MSEKILNVTAFTKFIEKEFGNNLSCAARELRIPKSTLSLLRDGKRNCGTKNMLRILNYLKTNNVKNDIIFF